MDGGEHDMSILIKGMEMPTEAGDYVIIYGVSKED